MYGLKPINFITCIIDNHTTAHQYGSVFLGEFFLHSKDNANISNDIGK